MWNEAINIDFYSNAKDYFNAMVCVCGQVSKFGISTPKNFYPFEMVIYLKTNKGVAF